MDNLGRTAQEVGLIQQRGCELLYLPYSRTTTP